MGGGGEEEILNRFLEILSKYGLCKFYIITYTLIITKIGIKHEGFD